MTLDDAISVPQRVVGVLGNGKRRYNPVWQERLIAAALESGVSTAKLALEHGMNANQMSDYKGAILMLDALPRAKALLGDRGYDADWSREALADRNISACIPSERTQKAPIPDDAMLYHQRHKIETMFGRLKDWRRIHTATTDAPTPSCPLFASRQPLSSGSINES
ncbi:MAG: hypothetical protein QM690_18485 [Sphingobium sp.]